MQFFFHGRPKAEVLRDPPADLGDRVRGDQAAARELYASGVFRQLWRVGYGAIGICEAASREEMERHLASLPLAQAGYIDVDLHEITPYPGFGPTA